MQQSEHPNQDEQQFDNQAFLEGLGQENQPDPPAKRETITVKFNGEIKEIPLEEAVVLTQKGLNYDRTLQQKEDLNAKALALEKENQILKAGEYPTEQDVLELQWLDFLQKYPDVKNPKDQLPNDVWKELDGGKSPCEAYGNYLAQQLSDKVEQLQMTIAALEQQAQTKVRAPGSMTGESYGGIGGDPFLEGLIQGFR